MRKHLFILGLLHTSLHASVSISVGIKNLDEIVNIKDLKKVVTHQNILNSQNSFQFARIAGSAWWEFQRLKGIRSKGQFALSPIALPEQIGFQKAGALLKEESSFANLARLEGQQQQQGTEKKTSASRDIEPESPAADVKHVRTSTWKKQEASEELAASTEKNLSEVTTSGKLVQTQIYDNTTHISLAEANCTDGERQLATEGKPSTNPSFAPPSSASQAKDEPSRSMEGATRNPNNNSTHGYWDMLRSWLYLV